jgi:L-ornithine N5-oxygenase
MIHLGSDEVQDLICIGFGPAALAIAIAFEEANASFLTPKPKVSFLERQSEFAWHSGMQIPGAKMQISFLKDLATLRNPQSPFTFINYLYQHNRLSQFINLGTFLPTRLEYQDYLRWCAGHFERQGIVFYGQEVVEVSPDAISPSGKVSQFCVVSRNSKTQKTTKRIARHVVIAAGGKPMLPSEFHQGHPRVVHSSRYAMKVDEALTDKTKPYRIAVVGSGQSAAEIFDDLPTRYPNARVTLIIKGSCLRPSDDSPFVNEIFDPDQVNMIYQQAEDLRTLAIARDRATNYGVVRLDLLEHLYQRLYMQRLQKPDSEDWRIRIKTNMRVVRTQGSGNGKVLLQLRKLEEDGSHGSEVEELYVDAVFVATGYIRNTHEDLMKNTRCLMREGCQDGEPFPVRRDYKVDFEEEKVERNAGIWLQGCNEKTHGVSPDTSLLTIFG